MALSLRRTALTALGLAGGFSVNRQVYGYQFTGSDGTTFGTLGAGDTLPGTNTSTRRSLARHLQSITGSAFDMVPVFVGHRNDFTGSFTLAQAVKTQYAIQVARDIYAQQNLGIRRIIWQHVPEDLVGSYANIANRTEAVGLADDWSGPPGGIDVFLVQSVGDADGWSHSPGAGPCDKNAVNDDLTGPVLEIGLNPRICGVLLAHEVGHYLGLAGGTDGGANLMGADVDANGVDEIGNNSTGLTDAQGTTMRAHCSVKLAV